MSVDIGSGRNEPTTGASLGASTSGPTEPIPAKSAQVKTDKPRPHVCATCTRSFARLEHLKRHERSHTKEKPFQCPVCERCFARRDLLLRHKQKLHASFPSDGPRGSISGSSGGGVGLGGGVNLGRPNVRRKQSNASSIKRSSISGASGVSPSSSSPGETSSSSTTHLGFDPSGTAGGVPVTTQPYSNLLRSQLGGINGLGGGIGAASASPIRDNSMNKNSNNNSNASIKKEHIRPNGEHFSTRPRPASFSAVSAASYSKFKDIETLNAQMYPSAPPQVGFSTPQLLPASLENIDNMPLDDIFISDPLFINPQLLGQNQNQTAGAPSQNTAPGNNNNSQNQNNQLHNQNLQQQQHHQHLQNNNRTFVVDNSSASSGYVERHSISSASYKLDEDMSPNSVLAMEHDDFSWMPPSSDEYNVRPTPQSILNSTSAFSPPPSGLASTAIAGGGGPTSESPLSIGGGGPGGGPSELGDSATTINSNNSHHQSHLSPDNFGGMEDLRDHKAFSLHVDGMDFWNSGYDENLSGVMNNNNNNNNNSNHGNGNLTMESNINHPPNVGLRSSRGQIITPQLRLHILATLSTPTPFSSSQPPQLPSTLELQRYINSYTENFGKHMPFLHHSLEFTPDNVPLALGMAAIGALYTFEHASSINIFEISRSCIHVYLESRRERKDAANNHSDGQPQPHNNKTTPLWLVQALVLGVIYGLFSSEPLANEIAVAQANAVISLAKSAGLHLSPSKFIVQPSPDLETAHLEDKWHYFISVQERIRTMHVVHMVSCLLATSYNVVSTLKNEDMRCGSPCDESLWTSTSSSEWWDIVFKKGLDVNPRQSFEGPVFNEYLQKLLQSQTLMDKVPQFTLLSLLYAIHHDIYQKRQAHDNGLSSSPSHREVTWLETQKLNIESVLRAWETTWSLSPLASLSPSSQYGPLMSDAIPLSSLAHVRVYVNLSKVKEAFWKRDFVAMNHELDTLAVPIYYEPVASSSSSGGAANSPPGPRKFDGLLEAASYAADAISLWEKHSIKWTLETTASQTFIHTLVSLFDCGLAVSEYLHRLEIRPQQEWSEEEALLVNRIGKIFYRVLDVVGHDSLDFTDGSLRPLNEDGTLSRPGKLSVLTLLIVSKILCKAYIWPFALVMGEALQARSRHLSGFSV